VILGIDVGGTKTAVLLGTRDGQVLQRREFPSNASRGFQPLYDDIVACAAEFGGYEEIGVSIGGPVDSQRGVVHSPPNLPGWDDIPLATLLRDRFGRPCYVEHDGKTGALAEWIFGAGRGCSEMVFLTLGTGLGAGVIANGQLLRGAVNCAGEVGHWRIAEDGPLAYGKRGSWEGLSSGSGLAQHGDVALAGHALGRGLALLIDLLAPERIVLGNLARRLGPAFLNPALQVLRQEALAPLAARCSVVLSELGDTIGDVAALSAAVYHGGSHA
jgi:glucokinase